LDLLVDIGNTNLKWAYRDSGGLKPGGTVTHGGRIPVSLTETWGYAPAPKSVWVSNVAGPAIATLLDRWTTGCWGLIPRYAEPAPQLCGVTNGYRDCRQLGVDRWLAMVAAFKDFAEMVVVVDCGTAVTIDAVRADGRHIGGLIMPGIRLMRSSLALGTQQLAVTLGGESSTFGDDTASCITAGTLQAIIGAVDRSKELARSHMGGEPILVVTGGDGATLASYLGCRFDAHLVLRGLVLWAEAA